MLRRAVVLWVGKSDLDAENCCGEGESELLHGSQISPLVDSY